MSVVYMEGAATVLIHPFFDIPLVWAIGTRREIREAVPVRGEVLKAEKNDLVFVLRIRELSAIVRNHDFGRSLGIQIGNQPLPAGLSLNI